MKYDLTTPSGIESAEADARTRADNERNQSCYNAAYLRGYANALWDVLKQMKQSRSQLEKYYAKIRWHVDDLKDIRPDWSDEQCRIWWEEHERGFKEVLTEYGNEVLSCIVR